MESQHVSQKEEVVAETPLMSLGILGGIGPESTGDFYRELISIFQNEFKPKDNTEFPHVIVNSIPAHDLIAIGHGDGDILMEYRDGLEDLEAWTADVAIVACNTAYCFYNEITRNLSIPVIHVRETVEKLLHQIQAKEILVLASPTTVKMGLYHFSGLTSAQLSDEEQMKIGEVIERYNIGNASDSDVQYVRDLAQKAVDRGVAVIAGCTEIHSILNGHVAHINPMSEMAREMIRIWVSMKQWKKIQSGIHGIGVASRIFISKGSIAYRIVFAKKASTFRKHWAYVEGMWYADGGAFDWLNHSCDPNVEIVMVDGMPALRALRDILPNEEITCDYEVTEGREGKEIVCSCGAKRCRGIFHIKV